MRGTVQRGLARVVHLLLLLRPVVAVHGGRFAKVVDIVVVECLIGSAASLVVKPLLGEGWG
jgi:hypothetical protein